MNTIEFVIADYNNPKHREDLVNLLDQYAQDPMAGGTALSSHVRENLVSQLALLPYAISILCYVDQLPAGLANCFESFSTFKCKPLINIHDFVIVTEFRGLGLSQKLLEKISDVAKEKGCCKITLELLEGNIPARQAYIKFGFEGYELDPATGKALFWQKEL